MIDKKWDIYVYGDLNIDLVIPGVEHLPLPGQEDVVGMMDTYIGGGAAIFTLGVGKLGMHAVFQGMIGNDCYGQFILNEFKNKNVDTNLISMSRMNKTGISISFTNEKDRSFLTYRGTNDEIDLSHIQLDQVKAAKHIHLTSYMGSKNHNQYLKLLKRIKEEGATTVSFDVGWDDTGEWYEGIYELYPYIDILFMNETEALHYSRKTNIVEAIKDFGHTCKLVVIKLGKKGAMAYEDGKIYELEAYKVNAVDPTGAGDSFNAGFVYGFLKGKLTQESLKFGNACGALSVTELGGNTGFPKEDELIEFIKVNER